MTMYSTDLDPERTESVDWGALERAYAGETQENAALNPDEWEWDEATQTYRRKQQGGLQPQFTLPDIDSFESPGNITTPTGEQFSTVSGDDIGERTTPPVFDPAWQQQAEAEQFNAQPDAGAGIEYMEFFPQSGNTFLEREGANGFSVRDRFGNEQDGYAEDIGYYTAFGGTEEELAAYEEEQARTPGQAPEWMLRRGLVDAGLRVPFTDTESRIRPDMTASQQNAEARAALERMGLPGDLVGLVPSKVRDIPEAAGLYYPSEERVEFDPQDYGRSSPHVPIHEGLHAFEYGLPPEKRAELAALIAAFPPPDNGAARHHPAGLPEGNPTGLTAYFDNLYDYYARFDGEEPQPIPLAIQQFIRDNMPQREAPQAPTGGLLPEIVGPSSTTSHGVSAATSYDPFNPTIGEAYESGQGGERPFSTGAVGEQRPVDPNDPLAFLYEQDRQDPRWQEDTPFKRGGNIDPIDTLVELVNEGGEYVNRIVGNVPILPDSPWYGSGLTLGEAISAGGEFGQDEIKRAIEAYGNRPMATGTGVTTGDPEFIEAAGNVAAGFVPTTPIGVAAEFLPGVGDARGALSALRGGDEAAEAIPGLSQAAINAGRRRFPEAPNVGVDVGNLNPGMAGASDDVTTKAADLKRQIDELKLNNDAGQNQQAINDLNARLKGQRMRDNAAIKAGGQPEMLPSGLAPSPVAVADEVPATAAPESTFSETDEFAGNIRLEKFPDESRGPIQQWAAENAQAAEDARRGVIPDEEVAAKARQLVEDTGGNWDKLKNRWTPGTAFNAEEILAVSGALAKKADEVAQLAKAAQLDDSAINQGNLVAALVEQAELQRIVHGVKAESGRSLRAQRQLVQMLKFEAPDAAAVRQALDEAGMDPVKVADVAKMLTSGTLDTPAKLNKLARDFGKPDFFDKLHFYWMNSILSGPITQTRNILGNLSTAAYSPVQRLAAAGLEQPMAALQGRQAERFWQESPAALVGLFQGVPEGVTAALKMLQSGISPRAAAKMDIRAAPIGGKLGDVIGTPTRLLGVADEFFSAINFRSELNAQAVRTARREGLKGSALTNRIAELVNDPPAGLMQTATDAAEKAVFRGDPGNTAKALANFRRNFPGGRYIVPFLNTPANLLKYGIKNSPLGLLDYGSWKKALDGNPEGIDEMANAFLGGVIGTALMGGVAAGVTDITTAAPVDPAERDAFFRSGKMPFSIRVPGVGWVEYKSIPVFDTTFTLVGGVVDGIRNGKSVDDVASQAVMNIGANLFDKSYMTGLGDLLDALQEPTKYAQKYALRQASGFFPASGLNRQTADFFDPKLRDPEGPVEQLKSQIPGLSQSVPSRLDVFGNEIDKGIPSPVLASADDQTEVDAELERLGMKVNFVGKSLGGHKLNRDEERAYQQMAGQATEAQLEALFSNEEYQGLSDLEKSQAVSRLLSKVREPAQDLLKKFFGNEAYHNLPDSQKRELLQRLVSRMVTE